MFFGPSRTLQKFLETSRKFHYIFMKSKVFGEWEPFVW